MEKIKIRNFLMLKEVDMEINKFNIIIGPQAEGKSIIAKLIYYFKQFTGEYKRYILSVRNQSDFDKSMKNIFDNIFPSYTWNNDVFEIIYNYGSLEIRIFSVKKGSRKTSRLFISYSDEITKLYRLMNRKYKLELKRQSSSQVPKVDTSKIETEIGQAIGNLFHPADNMMEFTTFIPAGRSFFSNLESRVWSFFQGDTSLDYFIKDFGATYENCKSLYHQYPKAKDSRFHEAKELFSEIMKGSFFHSTYDWIFSKDSPRMIPLSKSSSGQQEIVPMAAVLSVYGMVEKKSYVHFFLIEEPEAHLFPASQKLIVDLFILLYNLNQKLLGFFITTHSPYILTSLNNIIEADNLIKKSWGKNNQEEIRNKVFGIIPENKTLNFDEVSAYYLKDGTVFDLKDYDNRILNAGAIDDVSNQLNFSFNELLNIEAEIDNGVEL